MLPGTTLVAEAVTVVLFAAAAPGVTMIVGMVVVTGRRLMVALAVVAVPASTPVKVAV